MAAAPDRVLAGDPSDDTLGDLSLEELGDIEIVSVSRRAEQLTDAPASIYVISGEDIRRSGASSLPEALRLAPNLQVARVNANAYAISARGFNNAIGNKLQVLMDGVILYTPLFSGVFWDVPDVVLEDVERIEVISGPGATLWGANAVNGVINVITRDAAKTTGGLVAASGGEDERNLTLRWGGAHSGGAYRVHAKFLERDPTQRANGRSQQDGWHRGEIGFRADWGGATQGFTLSGAAYRGRIDVPQPADTTDTGGGHLFARWNRTLASGSGLRLQAYYDHRSRDIPRSIDQALDIYDIEFQHDVVGLDGHALSWGLNHRVAMDDVRNAPTIAFLPSRRNLQWTSAFVQDEMVWHEDRLRLVSGVRVERNSYTGTEVMPTLRLAWKGGERAPLWWVSASRALRTPSRFDRDLYAPEQPPFLIAGGPDFRSEVANVFELGHRAQPTARLSYSLTLFQHDYDRLRSFERTPSGQFVLGNRMYGRTQGVEAWGVLELTPQWRVSAGGTWLDMDLRLRSDSTDPTGVAAAGNDPEEQWQVRSTLVLGHGLEFEAGLRHVGALPAPRVPAYTALDARLGWRPNARLELSLAGQNLLDDGHAEFGNPLTASQFNREVRLGVRWAF